MRSNEDAEDVECVLSKKTRAVKITATSAHNSSTEAHLYQASVPIKKDRNPKLLKRLSGTFKSNEEKERKKQVRFEDDTQNIEKNVLSVSVDTLKSEIPSAFQAGESFSLLEQGRATGPCNGNKEDELFAKIAKLENEKKELRESVNHLASDLTSRIQQLEQEKHMHTEAMHAVTASAQESTELANESVSRAMEIISLMKQDIPASSVSPAFSSKEQFLHRSLSPRRSIFSRESLVTEFTQDTFAFMKVRGISRLAKIFSFWVYVVQMLLLTLIVTKQALSSQDTALLNVPIRIDWYTRLGQFLAIFLVVATSKDIVIPFREMSLLWITNPEQWGKLMDVPINHSNQMRLWLFYIAMPNLMQFLEGTLVLVASFIIIIQSADIFDLFQDFAAMQIIAEIDNAMFWLADLGYFGSRLKNDCMEIKRLRFTDYIRNICCGLQLRPLIMLIIFLSTIVVFIPITFQQARGLYFYDKYPNCLVQPNQIFKFGDGNCDGGLFNTFECAFDGHDCIDFNLAYPGCKAINPSKVGDGECHKENDNEQCGYDGGDCCEVINDEFWGDGDCHGGFYNTWACKYDRGDCNDFWEQFPYCNHNFNATNRDGKPMKLGDGVCEFIPEYMNDECGWEFGDCGSMAKEYEIFERDYPSCDFMIGAHENGTTKIGNGVCDLDLLTNECDWDGFDCCKDTQSLSFNGQCDAINLKRECAWDGFDCCGDSLLYGIQIPPWFNDGYCDSSLLNVECGFDGDDCGNELLELFPGCDFSSISPESFGDGYCDSVLNSTKCGFDGRDCDVIGVEFNANYMFYPFLDSYGGDIKLLYYVEDVEYYAQECDADPVCQGFNSAGWLKHTIKDKSNLFYWSFSPNEGLYVKKNYTF